jgi:hypothetical protein
MRGMKHLDAKGFNNVFYRRLEVVTKRTDVLATALGLGGGVANKWRRLLTPGHAIVIKALVQQIQLSKSRLFQRLFLLTNVIFATIRIQLLSANYGSEIMVPKFMSVSLSVCLFVVAVVAVVVAVVVCWDGQKLEFLQLS